VNSDQKKKCVVLRAFTLIELLVVVAIIAVLVAILLPSLATARRQARSIACLANLRQMATAMQMYSDEYNGMLMTMNVTLSASDYATPSDYDPYNRWTDWLRVHYLSGPTGAWWNPVRDPKYATTCPEQDMHMGSINPAWLWGGYGMNAGLPGGDGAVWTSVQGVQWWRVTDVVTPLDQSVYVTDTSTLDSIRCGWNLYRSLPWVAAPDWAAVPARRHGDGFNVLFMDGHAAYAKWTQDIQNSTHRWNIFGATNWWISTY
jgi:prepilin-type N-terminal cleavage/methylation domain-containing protein/prepilin-type processing-associated H-X9-DG protein